MSRREAPKRKVIDFWRSGEYGSVGWYVKLDCDHVEVRKRKPPKERMACTQCAGASGPVVPDGVVLDSAVVMSSTEERTKRLLARRLGIPEDSITVLFGSSFDSPSGARVYLDADDLDALLR